MKPDSPITEADLHAWVDGQLSVERAREVEAYVAARPEEAARVQAWRAQKQELHALYDPVQDEAVPHRLLRAGRPRTAWYAQRYAAGIAIALVSAATSWFARGALDADASRLASAPAAAHAPAAATGAAELGGFARRAAVAHVVYSPDVRRPVEVGADQEQQLVAWLSKRLGTPIRPPSLQALGYELIGGRLLPGDAGPVAQFMYHDVAGQRLTLYVTREVPKLPGESQTAFRFGQDGPVNVFYWVDKNFGYAISGGAERQVLLRVSQEVYRQLAPS